MSKNLAFPTKGQFRFLRLSKKKKKLQSIKISCKIVKLEYELSKSPRE